MANLFRGRAEQMALLEHHPVQTEALVAPKFEGTLEIGAPVVDRAWRLRIYSVRDTSGVLVGYLKTSAIDALLWAREYPTRWDYLTKVRGICAESEAAAEEAYGPRQWGRALENAERAIRQDQQRFGYHFVESIAVGSARDVENFKNSSQELVPARSDYRGLGLGQALYKRAAQHIAEESSQALFGSTVCSKDARRAWKALARVENVRHIYNPVGVNTPAATLQIIPYLDYTGVGVGASMAARVYPEAVSVDGDVPSEALDKMVEQYAPLRSILKSLRTEPSRPVAARQSRKV